MKRGEVWWIELGDRVGGEIRKRRPAVIVSNDSANRHLNRLQVVPLTSRTEKVYPSEAVVTVQKQKHKAMADQITTVSKRRVLDRMGAVSADDLRNVEHALSIQLGLLSATE